MGFGPNQVGLSRFRGCLERKKKWAWLGQFREMGSEVRLDPNQKDKIEFEN